MFAYLHPNEITTRRKVLLCEEAIKGGMAKRVEWEASTRGRELAAAKGMVYRLTAALKKLGVIIASSAATVAGTRDDTFKRPDR